MPKLVSESKKIYNKYNIGGEFGIGYTSKGEEFYFDLDDYDKIKDYCWYLNENKYLVTNSNNTIIRMTRLLMNILNNENI